MLHPFRVLSGETGYKFPCSINKQLISTAEHDSYWFSPGVKTRVFGVLTRFARFMYFCDFWVILSRCCPCLECLVVRLVENFLDLILMLHNRLLTLAFLAMFAMTLAFLTMFANNVTSLKL